MRITVGATTCNYSRNIIMKYAQTQNVSNNYPNTAKLPLAYKYKDCHTYSDFDKLTDNIPLMALSKFLCYISITFKQLFTQLH